MLKIIEQFFKSFGELFPDIKIRRFVLAVIFIALPLLVWFIDSQTNLIFFWYLQRKVEILKNLCGINKELVLNNEHFTQAYTKIFDEMDAHSYFSIAESISKTWLSITLFCEGLLKSESVWKFFWGAFVGFGFGIFSVIKILFGDKSYSDSLSGALIFGIIFGIIGFLIPPIFSPTVNYISYPILQITLLIYYGSTIQALPKSSSSENQ
jgi:hypothetical protein